MIVLLLIYIFANRDIAIDDVLFKRDVSCPNVYDCDFESDCTWQNEKDDRLVQLTWIINSGGTPSVETGPTGDSTNSVNGRHDLILFYLI